MDFSRPVPRPKDRPVQADRARCSSTAGPGYLQFAITNICNAKCDFCGFAVDRFDPKQRRSVTLQEARDVIDICVKNHIGYLLFVGGEPLVHKDLRAMTRYAAERGIHPMICTNGSLWTEQNMRDLAGDGLSSVIMSIDAHDVAKHEKNRGLPDVCRKIKRANEVFRELGVQTTASVTASRLIDDYDKLPGVPDRARLPELHLQLPAQQPGLELPELQRFQPGQLQDRGADPGLREDQADEAAQRLPGGQPRRIAHRDAAPSAPGAGEVRLPGRPQVLLPGLEPEPLPLPFLGDADVQHLRVRPVEAHPRRLHAVHD